LDINVMFARLRLTITTAAAMLAASVTPAVGQPRPLPADVGPVAGSDVFVIQSCGETGSADGWAETANNAVSAISTGINCPPSSHIVGDNQAWEQAGLWVSDHLGNTSGLDATPGDRGELTFSPLPGTTIVRLRYWRLVTKDADNSWHPYISLGTTGNVIDTCEIVSHSACAEGGYDWYANDTHFENNRESYSDLAGLSTNKIIVGLDCRPNPDNVCGNGYSVVNVHALILSAFITIADPTAPTLGTPTGDGWTTDDWVQGTAPLSLLSSDTTGISATRVYADGSLIATLQRSCSYTRPRPCTDETAGTIGIPTVGLADGMHAIEVGAVDAAGNETRVARATVLKVDNQAPAAPVGLSSPAATSSTNNFSASWSLPADAGAPIVGARYQICQNGSCGPMQAAPSLTRVDGLSLPAAGEGTLRAWLVDALGHQDPGSVATLTLAYTPPPAVSPAPASQPTAVDSRPAPVPIVASQPTPVPAKASPSLKIASLRVTGRRVALRGTVSAKASGRLTVRFRVRAPGHRLHTITTHPKITAHAFRTTLTLPRSLARARAGTAVVSYAGDADTKPASRSATIRWHG
jgi:hypothetical protein